jgi:hypothetical protein
MKNLLSIARNQTEATRKTPHIVPNELPNDVPLRFYQKRDSRLVVILCSEGLVFAARFAGEWSLTILRDILAQAVLILSRHPSAFSLGATPQCL